MAIDIELKTLKQNNTSWPLTFKASNRFPIVANRVFATLENAQKYIDDTAADASAYPGIVLAVVQDEVAKNNGVYYVKSVAMAEGEKGVLVKVGGAETETATNYSAAKELSKTLVVGQLIKVANAEEIEETVDDKVVKNTYQAGFYIVEGSGVISALSTSTGSDDEVGALKTRVTNLETNSVKNSDFETYKAGVTSALDGKVSNTDFGAHAASGVSSADKALHVSSEEKVKWNNADKYTDEEIAKLTTVYDAKGAAAQALADAKADAADKYQVKGDYEVAGTAASLNAAMDTRMTAVEGDVATLKAIDHDAYKTADEVLQGAIDKVADDLANEVTARGTLDTTLRGLISAETTARETAISVEASARETLAATLRSEISAAQGAAEKVATDFNTAMNGRVAKLEAIDHEELMSNAINAWAQAESNDETVNTFKELVDYAATHKSEFTEIFGEVQGMKKSKADADALSQEVTDRKAADAELQGAINTEKSARESAIAEVNAEVAKKANQTDLDALNVLIGKASVEGGESGSGLVKRIEDLEVIDHDAYKSADATLKADLQGEISKKADITALNNEVSAREALAAIVGTRAEGDTESVFTKLAALASAVDGKLAKNATVNNVAFENGAVVIDAGDIALESAIMSDNGKGGKVEQYPSTNSIQAVLQSLNNRITAAVSGGLTSVAAGDGIAVTDVIGNSQTVSIKLSAVENNAAVLQTDGIYVQAIMVDGNDME